MSRHISTLLTAGLCLLCLPACLAAQSTGGAPDREKYVAQPSEQSNGLTRVRSLDQQPTLEEVPDSPVLPDFGPITSLTADIGLPTKLQRTEDELQKQAGDLGKRLEDYAEEIFGPHGSAHYALGAAFRDTDVILAPISGDFCYRPLYFEEANLERYGNHRGCLQPVESAGRFFATIPALPYLMTLEHPEVCFFWSRPYPAGRPAPRVRELPRVDLKAGAVTGGLATGLIFLFP